jgi:acyl transferase domain-containing protein/aryl carrier-like protein
MSETVPPVAVVGLACRFPGGPDVPTFWKLLVDGGNAIIDIPADRWNLDALKLFNDGKPVPRNVTRGGWLPDVKSFDNTFFRMSPREAKTLDPKQRLVLEVTYEAFEDARLAPDQITDLSTGVFVGCAQSEYLQRFFWRMEIGGPKSDRYCGPGNDPSFTSGRISAMFGFDGPSVNVNTACSTSLVAIHQAIRAIQNGECDVAAAGGVAIIQNPEHSLTMNQFGVLAPDSQCKAFDAGADGYVRAEGCGVVVLRRLDHALAHGDRIYAVIRGSAVNHNGLSDNIMAPEAEAQTRLLVSALQVGGVDPATIDLIEAHGTGTTVGDPIEIQALADVFAAPGRQRNAWVGSVKTNVGHLEVGAGVAGFIKAVLALHHRKIPAHLHLKQLNPAIDRSLPFTYPTTTVDWPAGAGPRRAVVNSFGISGINAAVVLEEAPAPRPVVPANERSAELIVLSAYGDGALKSLAHTYAARMDAGWRELAYTAATGRNSFPSRLAVVAASPTEAAEELRKAAAGQGRMGDARAERPRTAFLFTGQGAQHVGMGREVYAAEPAFREVIDQCDALFSPLLGRSLRSVMFGQDPTGAEAADLDDTLWTQPALFSVELAMAALWRSWGVEPDVLVGHSIGELAAAVVAGVMTLPDAARLVAARGRLMSALPRDGAMAAVFADVETVRQAIAPYGGQVSIASDNGPTSTVISGVTAQVEAVIADFERRDVSARKLNVSHAFHSALMEPMLAAFREVAASIPMKAPSIPILSNVTGAVADASITTADYWVQHVRGAVRFREDMLAMAADKVQLVIELGPEPHLVGMGRRCLSDPKITWVASQRKDRPWRTLLEGVADAWLAGARVRWAAFWQHHRGARVDLPPYPFQRRAFWVDDPGPMGTVAALGASVSAPAAVATGPTYDRAAHYRLRWTPIEGYTPRTLTHGTYIVGLDRGGVLEQAARALEAAGHQVVRVVPAATTGPQGDRFGLQPADMAGFRELAEQHKANLRAWVHGWSLDAPHDEGLTGRQWTETAETTSLTTMFIAQAVLGAGAPGAGVALVTAGADAVLPGESPRLAQSGGWGVARVVGLEHRTLPNWRIDLDPARPDANALARLLLAPPTNEDQLALRRGGLHALRLVAHQPSGVPLRPRADGAWLVTGGLGALGLAVGEWLITRGVTKLILCGRSAPNAEAQAAVARMQAAGATVLVEAMDVANPTHVQNLFHYVARKGVTLRGVVHAAGVLADGPVLRQDRERFYQVFPAKVEGAWNLHKATENLDLDAFILFSSVTSTLGAPGQVNYAAANAFLDALAWHRLNKGLPAVSINWGPWGEIGMAAKLAALMASRGMGGLKTAEALDAMGASAQDLAPQVTFMDMRVRDILAREPGFKDAPLMREIMRDVLGEAPRAAAPRPTAPPPAQAAPPAPPAVTPALTGDRREALIETISGMAGKLLGFAPGELDPKRPLAWQGFDSVMAIDLRARIRAELGVDLDADLLVGGPKVTELADEVLKRLPAAGTVVVPAAPRAIPTPVPAPTVATSPPVADPRGALLAWLVRASEQLLGFNPGDLDPNRPLAWQGFDSVMALDLQRRIKDELGADLPLDVLVNGPKLTELRDELQPRVDARRLSGPVAAPATPAPAAPAYTAPPVYAAPTVHTAPPAAPPAATPTDRASTLAWLVLEAERLLGFSPGDLDANRPLAWQGFDSVMALDLQRRIKDELGAELPLDVLVNGPKLGELVDEVMPRITRRAAPQSATPQPAPQPNPAPQPAQAAVTWSSQPAVTPWSSAPAAPPVEAPRPAEAPPATPEVAPTPAGGNPVLYMLLGMVFAAVVIWFVANTFATRTPAPRGGAEAGPPEAGAPADPAGRKGNKANKKAPAEEAPPAGE